MITFKPGEQKGRAGVLRPMGSKEGAPWLVCRQDAQSSGAGTWQVLMAGAGELKEVETGAMALLCCREDADRKWEKRVRPFILPSYLQHACPIDRTCQEACWQRSLINECKPQYYRGKCRIMSLGSEIIINRPCYRNNNSSFVLNCCELRNMMNSNL